MRGTQIVVLAAVMAAACKASGPHGFDQPLTLGGKVVPAAVLSHGEKAYLQYCRACHGDAGDGKGPSSPGLRPPPRDFTQGTFKFAAVPGGMLPNDDDLVRIVRGGLHGTAMLAWDGVPQADLEAIVQYLKTFSPRWRSEAPGQAIVSPPDPWQEKPEAGAARGRAMYHGMAQCNSCHPSYASRAEIYRYSKELTGNAVTDSREDPYGAVLKESDYGVKLLPPDFTRSELRSVRDGHELEDLYRIIASGVGGTAMPTWQGALPDADLWALAHYVASLRAERGSDAPGRQLAANLKADESWAPPAEGEK
jgi:mono/diheme cytochrome c family protein